MIERIEQRFGIKPKWVAGDTAYGPSDNLGWLMNEKGIEPHVPVIDKLKCDDGTFSRDDFTHDAEHDCYVCPGGADLISSGRLNYDKSYRYIASVNDCRARVEKHQQVRRSSVSAVLLAGSWIG